MLLCLADVLWGHTGCLSFGSDVALIQCSVSASLPGPPHNSHPITHTLNVIHPLKGPARALQPRCCDCTLLRAEEKDLKTCCFCSPEARRFLHTSQICSPFDVGVLTHVLPPPNRFTWTLRLQLHPHPFPHRRAKAAVLSRAGQCKVLFALQYHGVQHRRKRGRKLRPPIRMDGRLPSLSYTFSASYFLSCNDPGRQRNCRFQNSSSAPDGVKLCSRLSERRRDEPRLNLNTRLLTAPHSRGIIHDLLHRRRNLLPSAASASLTGTFPHVGDQFTCLQ